MAKVPEGQDITTWDPTDAVWFRIYADEADLSGSTITWPSDGAYLIPQRTDFPAFSHRGTMKNTHQRTG